MKVQYYAKAKDWILGSWIEICKKVHKNKRRGVTFIDLYAGDGVCECTLPSNDVEKWPGSALRAAMAGCSGEADISVIVNEKNDTVFRSLESRLSEYGDCVKGLYNEDARNVIDEILDSLDPAGHNFFFLDPYGHGDIDMELIRKVSSFGGKREKYKDDYFTRRPEMLLNLPSKGMARCVGAQEYDSVSRFFGHEDWLPFVIESREKYGEAWSYYLTLQVLEELSEFYPQHERKSCQIPFEVINQQNKTIMYWLLMFTTHPLARGIYSNFIKYAERFRENDVLRKWVEIREIAKAKRDGIKTLDEWYEKT